MLIYDCHYTVIFLLSADRSKNVRAAMALVILFFGGLASALVFLYDTYPKMIVYSSVFGFLNGTE